MGQWRMRQESEGGPAHDAIPRDETKRLERRIAELERIVQRLRDGKEEQPEPKRIAPPSKPGGAKEGE